MTEPKSSASANSDIPAYWGGSGGLRPVMSRLCLRRIDADSASCLHCSCTLLFRRCPNTRIHRIPRSTRIRPFLGNWPRAGRILRAHGMPDISRIRMGTPPSRHIHSRCNPPPRRTVRTRKAKADSEPANGRPCAVWDGTQDAET